MVLVIFIHLRFYQRETDLMITNNVMFFLHLIFYIADHSYIHISSELLARNNLLLIFISSYIFWVDIITRD